MSLRIPPVAQFFACAFLAWGLARLLPQLSLGSSVWIYAGFGFIAAGAILLALAVLAFVRARTTVNPLSPEQAETLVTSGLYPFQPQSDVSGNGADLDWRRVCPWQYRSVVSSGNICNHYDPIPNQTRGAGS